jgi:predicted nucleotidyltransferase
MACRGDLGRPQTRVTLAETPHLSAAERSCLERFGATLVDELGDELEALWLFGSAARGDRWPDRVPMRSDIDLLVVTEKPLPAMHMEALVSATYPLFLESGTQIDAQFRTRDWSRPAESVLLWRRA